MSKTIEEKIEIMQHYAKGGEVQCCSNNGKEYENFDLGVSPSWNWQTYDYRIKEQKITVTIEKWLCLNSRNRYKVIEGCREYIKYTNVTKLKLLETYEVNL